MSGKAGSSGLRRFSNPESADGMLKYKLCLISSFVAAESPSIHVGQFSYICPGENLSGLICFGLAGFLARRPPVPDAGRRAGPAACC